MMVVGWWSNICQGAEMALPVKHRTGPFMSTDVTTTFGLCSSLCIGIV